MLALVSPSPSFAPDTPVIEIDAQAAEQEATEMTATGKPQLPRACNYLCSLEHDFFTRDCWKIHLLGPTPAKVMMGWIWGNPRCSNLYTNRYTIHVILKCVLLSWKKKSYHFFCRDKSERADILCLVNIYKERQDYKCLPLAVTSEGALCRSRVWGRA